MNIGTALKHWWERNKVLAFAYIIMFFLIMVAVNKFTLLEQI